MATKNNNKASTQATNNNNINVTEKKEEASTMMKMYSVEPTNKDAQPIDIPFQTLEVPGMIITKVDAANGSVRYAVKFEGDLLVLADHAVLGCVKRDGTELAHFFEKLGLLVSPSTALECFFATASLGTIKNTEYRQISIPADKAGYLARRIQRMYQWCTNNCAIVAKEKKQSKQSMLDALEKQNAALTKKIAELEALLK